MPPVRASVHAAATGTAFSFGVAALLTVLAVILLAVLGWALFMGVNAVLAVVMVVLAIVAAWRDRWIVASVLGAAALLFLFFDPFSLSVLDVRLSMGVDPYG